MTIAPTHLEEIADGRLSVRVEGDDIRRCLDAKEAATTVYVPNHGPCHVVTCSVVGGAGFFVLAPAPASVLPSAPAPDEVTQPRAKRRVTASSE